MILLYCLIAIMFGKDDRRASLWAFASFRKRKWYNDAMDVKKTAAQRLVELLRMTLAELREQRTISTGRSVFNDDIDTLKLPLPDKIRDEIIEAELDSGTISK